MKRFKFSFLAFVAIVATSFTVASHQGAFKAKSNVPDGCYKNITAGGLNLNLGNVDPYPAGGGGAACTNKASATYSGGSKYYCVGSGSSPVFGTVSAASNPVNKTTDCTATNNPCCYEIENDQVVRICYKP